MSFSKLSTMLLFTGVMLAWTASSVHAADITTPTPVVAGAAPLTVGDAGCATCQSCQHGLASGSCPTCGKLITGARLHKSNKKPYPVNLCPGACFGYFQTQWRKWDEVCPYPYLGMGPNPNLNLAPDGMMPPGGLAPPRPLDQKMPDPKKVGSDVPPIPVVPNKFGP